MRKTLIILLGSIAILLAGYVGYRTYKVWKSRHLMGMAHEFVAKKEVRSALLCVQQVLQTDPQNLAATRMMAQLMTAARSPNAVVWWSRVVELDPHSITDRLDLAQTALMSGNYVIATNALGGVEPSETNTVGYQNLAGTVALAIHQPAQAKAHFQEAARLDPQNPSVRFNLAVMGLNGSNHLDQAQARITLKQISQDATNAPLRIHALLELTQDALRHRQVNQALSFSEQLVQATNSTFQDRLVRLSVLQDTKNAAFKPTLTAYQHEAAGNPREIAELATWQMARTSPQETLRWLRTLSPAVQTNLAVQLPIAECCTMAREWRGLQTTIQKQNWGELEFLRHAFLTQSLRQQGMADSAKAEWELAVQAAANHGMAGLSGLLRLAAGWRWQNRTEEILRMIINRYPSNLGAVQALSRLLGSEGRTQSLMQLYSQETKLFPSNNGMKNNLAMTALLLDRQDVKPYELAREVYQASPTNASYVSTYAFSLYKQGKNAEAFNVMQTLSSSELQEPSIAGYYGLILKARGERAKARAYLDWSAKASLLPQEKKMFDRAKAGL